MYLKLAAALLGLSVVMPAQAAVERIEIRRPAFDGRVRNPVRVSGIGQATQHNQLDVRIRDGNGKVIGQGTARVQGPLGRRGAFSTVVYYKLKAAAPEHGRIEVFDTSPRDGEMIHLSSVEVRLTPTSR